MNNVQRVNLAVLAKVVAFARAILPTVTPPASKMPLIARLFFAFLFLSIIVSAFFDLESQSGQEDAHLIYNAVRRAAVVQQPYYVAAPDHKGPLWMFVYSLALKIAHDGVHFWFVISAFCILVAIATVLCAWKLSKIWGSARILPAAVALSALIYLLLGPEDYTKVLFARNLSSLLTVASLALLSFIPGKTHRQILLLSALSGSLLGLAVQTVPSVAIVAPIVAAFLIYFVKRSQNTIGLPFGLFLLCSLVFCFSAPVWYYLQGAFSDFWVTWWTYNGFYVESKLVGPIPTLKRIAAGYYFYYRAHPLFGVILIVFFVQMFFKKSSEERRLDVLLFSWFALEAIAVAATQRFFENYMIQIFVPTATMAIAMAARYGARLTANKQTYLGIAVCFLIFFIQGYDRFKEGIRFLSEYKSKGIESTIENHLADLTPEERDLRAYVQKSTSPDDYVYIWSSHPQLYSAVDRVAGVRYLRNSWLIGRIHGGGGIHKEYVLPVFWQNWKKDLQDTTPVLIVIPLKEAPAPDSPLTALLHCGYTPVWHNTGFEVWKFNANRACLEMQIN